MSRITNGFSVHHSFFEQSYTLQVYIILVPVNVRKSQSARALALQEKVM